MELPDNLSPTDHSQAGERTSLRDDVRRLAEERNAVILAHNYQREEVQDVADFVGDSLGLSQQAAATDAAVIVFCGVDFMAETAAILSPDKIVLHPDPKAGCPMANMITATGLRQMKAEYPALPVVCYVNSKAEVKAESDWCCTSANAAKVVSAVPHVQAAPALIGMQATVGAAAAVSTDRQSVAGSIGQDGPEMIFVPDKYLGQHVAGLTGRRMLLWPGYCPTHARITPEDIERALSEHPKARVMVHPECRPEVTALADAVLSTGGMLDYAKRGNCDEFIVGTETGMIYPLSKANPEKRFYPAGRLAVCPNMKKITLEKVLWSLQDMEPRVTVPEDIRLKAKLSIDRMLEIGR